MIPEPRDGSVVLATVAENQLEWQRIDVWASEDSPMERWFSFDGWETVLPPRAFSDLTGPVLIHEGKPV